MRECKIKLCLYIINPIKSHNHGHAKTIINEADKVILLELILFKAPISVNSIKTIIVNITIYKHLRHKPSNFK